MYCDVRDFTQFVGVDYETLVKILKRKYRSVDVPSSFRSRMFHAPVKGCFFSVKCFKLLYGKNYIKKVGPGINKTTVVKELDGLLEKYTKEDDEMEEDDIVQMITSDNEEDSNPQVDDVFYNSFFLTQIGHLCSFLDLSILTNLTYNLKVSYSPNNIVEAKLLPKNALRILS